MCVLRDAESVDVWFIFTTLPLLSAFPLSESWVSHGQMAAVKLAVRSRPTTGARVDGCHGVRAAIPSSADSVYSSQPGRYAEVKIPHYAIQSLLFEMDRVGWGCRKSQPWNRCPQTQRQDQEGGNKKILLRNLKLFINREKKRLRIIK